MANGRRPSVRCVLTDLDQTLLGAGRSMLRDAEGEPSLHQASALFLCLAAEIEVVPMTAQGEPRVKATADLIGSGAYIYEGGCAVVIDGERTLLTGELVPDSERSVADKIRAAAVPELLCRHFGDALEFHMPDEEVLRAFSLLFRGKVDAGEANALLRDHGLGYLRFVDNGVIAATMPGLQDPHSYHVVPREASKPNAAAFYIRKRGYRPDECVGIGDSIEDLAVAKVVGRFFVPANGPPAMRKSGRQSPATPTSRSHRGGTDKPFARW